MANFTTHISTSTVLGLAYGGAAYGLYDVPLSTSILAGGLCSVSGMLPDLDSNSGVPLRESVAFAAAVVPMMLVDRFRQFGMSPESMVLAGAAVYLSIRFGLARLLKAFTVHRGMFHSIPAAVIFFEIAFLLTSGSDVRLRYYKAGAVALGYVSHLLLDELYSLEWYRGRWRLKKSFGTALKLFGDKLWPNVSTYAKLGVLTFLVFFEPGWMDKLEQRYEQRQAQYWAQRLAEYEAQQQAHAGGQPSANDRPTALRQKPTSPEPSPPVGYTGTTVPLYRTAPVYRTARPGQPGAAGSNEPVLR
jgi:membrane-bound metal-dependent hydrolase YbcI (DUF457 family)